MSGSVYRGHFLNDLRHGHGSLTHANGDVYEGEFVNGECHGTGTCNYSGGTKYEGEWAHNLPHGAGTMSYGDGSSYRGGFKVGPSSAPLPHPSRPETFFWKLCGATYLNLQQFELLRM